MSSSKNNFDRRKFIKSSALLGTLLGFSGASAFSKDNKDEVLEYLSKSKPATGKSVIGLKVAPIEQVRVAFIGVGMRGSSHVKQIAAIHPKAVITAVCDIRDEQAKKSIDFLKSKGQKAKKYSGNKDAWKKMLKRDDIDLVIISTPWEHHVPMSVYAMEQGKHVALEVPAAYTVEDCWKLVNTAEQTQRHCMMLENVCYGDEELAILNMVDQGVFGTLTHGEAAYIHDLKHLMFDKTGGYYEQWRLRHHAKYDGNLYPTHGLGPVAQYMGINRGDRFGHLVSMSSLEASLSEYSQTIDLDNEFYKQSEFKHGDMNTSLIQTAKGSSIMVQHDVVSPRPYSRINALTGTKAYHEGYPSRLSISGKGHGWLNDTEYKAYREKYKHPIWNKLKSEIEKNGGHGGMDFVMLYRLIDCLNKGKTLDQDVYDGVDWSVVTPLSVISVELGNIPVKFPDFTRGKWMEERTLGIMENL